MEGVDTNWMVWRPILDPDVSVSKTEIEESYTLNDLMDLHQAMDIRDQMSKANQMDEKYRKEED